jgi:hypothetical protein
MVKEQSLDNTDGHELISVAEFAKRIGRNPYTVWGRIRSRNMPPGTVFKGPEGLKIDFTRWQQAQREVQAQGLRRVI